MKASIVIPTRNRSKDLQIALTSVVNQTYQNNYEIVVVDNGSDDNTADVCIEFKNKLPRHIEFRYEFEPVPGQLSGRHKGVEISSGEILIFIDDDIKADDSWLSSIMNAFKTTDADLIGGPSYPMYETEPPVWLQNLWVIKDEDKFCAYYSLIDLGSKGKYIDPRFVWGLNFSIRKKALIESGGFHPDCVPAKLQMYQGDGETGLAEKFRQLGLKAWYEPAARVGHLVSKERMTLDYIYKRQFYQGVCDSYTLIRKTKGLTGWNLKFHQPNLFKLKIKYFLLKNFKRKNKLEQMMDDGYYNGYWFHQNAAAKNKQLVKWIIQDNYWDYRLPN